MAIREPSVRSGGPGGDRVDGQEQVVEVDLGLGPLEAAVGRRLFAEHDEPVHVEDVVHVDATT